MEGRARGAGRPRREGQGGKPRRESAGQGGKPRREGAAARGGSPRGGPRGSSARPGADAATPARPRRIEPDLPEEVTGRELDRDVRAELRALSAPNATAVARHLVMAARLLDTDPEGAWLHAVAAQKRAGRIGVVREAAGLAAYRSGRFSEALSELRTARRLTGSNVHLPIMADCERGLGRPDRALAILASPEARELDQAGRVELAIVASGARGDLGQADAAVVTLQIPELARGGSGQPWFARLAYAYADALLAAGRAEESRTWLERAAATDVDGQTDADERLAELDGVQFFIEEPLEPGKRPGTSDA